MVYTLTLNPALDFTVFGDEVIRGEINESKKEFAISGGKGINVSRCLKELGVESVATGFLAGFTGEKIETDLKLAGIKTDFVKLKNGFSRINVKIRDGAETDINGQGPEITEENLAELFEKFKNIKSGDILVLAGSVPKTIPQNIYALIIKKLLNKGIKFVVDARGEALKEVLKYKPFLIKPNLPELEELFNLKISNNAEVIKYAKILKEQGAENVVVSLGGNGAVFVTSENEVIVENAITGTVKNTVGAGDSMVAGIIAGYIKTKEYNFALKLGIAAGSATAFSEGIAKRQNIEKILKLVGGNKNEKN